ncbi:hypothetical protein M011DRAFT_476308 [Sporormia fimetaria CBS 119925]|uniref:Uncharacterized protein n=1 Tax=Sporormia fimetaria CBS 119925 TaxID=1340428 RepID=A0A6A6VDL9_9PLEO|nr:hypothetical protein M011DRAFT_476308 [Sporormia fimetaria CBS 119925]
MKMQQSSHFSPREEGDHEIHREGYSPPRISEDVKRGDHEIHRSGYSPPRITDDVKR